MKRTPCLLDKISVVENCSFLGHYISCSANSLKMFRNNSSVPISRFKNQEVWNLIKYLQLCEYCSHLPVQYMLVFEVSDRYCIITHVRRCRYIHFVKLSYGWMVWVTSTLVLMDKHMYFLEAKAGVLSACDIGWILFRRHHRTYLGRRTTESD